MHQPVCPAPKSQHLDGFGAQECHARRIGLAPDPALAGEVAAQVRPHLVQRFVSLRCGAAAMVRFTPESASKTASFVVSKANSTDCADGGLRLGGNPCHELVFGHLRLGRQLVELRRLHAGPAVVKYTYLSAPSDSTRSTLTSKVSALMRW